MISFADLCFTTYYRIEWSGDATKDWPAYLARELWCWWRWCRCQVSIMSPLPLNIANCNALQFWFLPPRDPSGVNVTIWSLAAQDCTQNMRFWFLLMGFFQCIISSKLQSWFYYLIDHSFYTLPVVSVPGTCGHTRGSPHTGHWHWHRTLRRGGKYDMGKMMLCYVDGQWIFIQSWWARLTCYRI